MTQKSHTRHMPGFQIRYKTDTETGHQPDREKIAQGWPNSIDDSAARRDWGWKPEYDLARMTEDMLLHLQEGLSQFTFNTGRLPIKQKI